MYSGPNYLKYLKSWRKMTLKGYNIRAVNINIRRVKGFLFKPKQGLVQPTKEYDLDWAGLIQTFWFGPLHYMAWSDFFFFFVGIIYSKIKSLWPLEGIKKERREFPSRLACMVPLEGRPVLIYSTGATHWTSLWAFQPTRPPIFSTSIKENLIYIPWRTNVIQRLFVLEEWLIKTIGYW